MAGFHQISFKGFRSQRDLTCTKKDVACCWMPRNDANTLGVAFQYHHWFRHGSNKAILWDLPDLWRT